MTKEEAALAYDENLRVALDRAKWTAQSLIKLIEQYGTQNLTPAARARHVIYWTDVPLHAVTRISHELHLARKAAINVLSCLSEETQP